MNRKLSAAAAMAASAVTSMPAPAQTAPGSNVIIYGLVDAVVRRASNVSAKKESVVTLEDGLITGSRLGFRGSEDIGGGLRAVFTLESGFDPSSGASLQGTTTADFGQDAASPRFWGREINLSLRNSWGGVTLGRQYTTAHQIAIRFQPQGNPNNTALSVFSSHHVARQDNVAKLDGKFGDFDVQASRTFGELADNRGNNSWAAGGGYTGASFAVGAYVQNLENRAGTETRKIVGAGGNYKINDIVAVFAGAMKRSSNSSLQVNKVWALGANVEVLPATTVSVEYFSDKQTGSPALNGARKVGWVTANYRFSKRTDVYATVDRNKVDGGYTKPAFMGVLGTQTAVSMAIRHRF